ncbi:MAG TPA: hypothetical protein VGJ20_01415 [Xanthobacteraceae bacterium]
MTERLPKRNRKMLGRCKRAIAELQALYGESADADNERSIRAHAVLKGSFEPRNKSIADIQETDPDFRDDLKARLFTTLARST